MPDKRKHRGAHPKDAEYFNDSQLVRLRTATADLSWLWSRGYADTASLKLVGDRYHLKRRQRLAILRAACADANLERRQTHHVKVDQLKGQMLAIDGFNQLIIAESALSQAFLLCCRDGCLRDMASVHGTYRRVEETGQAIQLWAKLLRHIGVAGAIWYFDQPVSNSGRLKNLIAETVNTEALNWAIELVDDPDPILKRTEYIVISSDAMVINEAGQWSNLAPRLVERYRLPARIVDLEVG